MFSQHIENKYFIGDRAMMGEDVSFGHLLAVQLWGTLIGSQYSSKA